MTSSASKARTACDQCRFRKLRCDGSFPCERCYKTELDCTFNAKASRSRRIDLLRRASGRQSLEPCDPIEDTASLPVASNRSHAVQKVLPRSNISTSSDETSINHPECRLYRQPEDLTSPWPAGHDTTAESWISPSSITASTSQHQSHMTLTPRARDSHPADPLLRSSIQDFDLAARSTIDTSKGPSGASPADQLPSWTSVIIDSTLSLPKYARNELLPWLDIFFDRLYPTLPIVNRSKLYRDVLAGRQGHDGDFAAMVLSLCALALVQPVFEEEHDSMPVRVKRATEMLESASRSRRHTFGEDISIEAVVASFFLFAALFGMGHQKAAWLRLREAVECGKLIGLHRLHTYQDLEPSDKGRWFRLFLILSVTERGYALQRNHSIVYTGQHLLNMKGILTEVEASTTTKVSGIVVHDDRDVSAMRGILQLMKLFDSVDEEVIACCNRSCSVASGNCYTLSIDKAKSVYKAISSAMPSTTVTLKGGILEIHTIRSSTAAAEVSVVELNKYQWADCFVLQQWLLIRLWVACMTHEILDETSSEPLIRPSFAVKIAHIVWQECQRLDSSVLEVHGLGMIERLHDIAMGVIMYLGHCQETGDETLIIASNEILEKYLILLGQLRNGVHRFCAAIKEAYNSIGVL